MSFDGVANKGKNAGCSGFKKCINDSNYALVYAIDNLKSHYVFKMAK
jgi:hypothetical protein